MSLLGGGTGTETETAGGTHPSERNATGGQALHIRKSIGESKFQQFAGETRETEPLESLSHGLAY